MRKSIKPIKARAAWFGQMLADELKRTEKQNKKRYEKQTARHSCKRNPHKSGLWNGRRYIQIMGEET